MRKVSSRDCKRLISYILENTKPNNRSINYNNLRGGKVFKKDEKLKLVVETLENLGCIKVQAFHAFVPGEDGIHNITIRMLNDGMLYLLKDSEKREEYFKGILSGVLGVLIPEFIIFLVHFIVTLIK